MKKRHFTEFTEEDFSYAALDDELLDFGYISRKDQRAFNEFLIENRIIVQHGKGVYRPCIPFRYTNAKQDIAIRMDFHLEISKQGWVDLLWVEV